MIISITNQKGGVGKTTTAVTLAYGAALQGKSVCLVDLDTQGNVADSLGIEGGNDLQRLLIDQETLVTTTVLPRPGLRLFVVRADKRAVGVKTQIAAMDFRERIIADALDGYKAAYDLVIMDCAPSVDVLHTAALVASDLVIIPTKLDTLAVKGVGELLRSIRSVQRATRSNVQIAGIIPTMYDQTTRETREQLENLAASFGSLVWPVIPVDNACRSATRSGQTLWETAPGSRAILGNVLNGKRFGGYSQALDRLMLAVGGNHE